MRIVSEIFVSLRGDEEHVLDVLKANGLTGVRILADRIVAKLECKQLAEVYSKINQIRKIPDVKAVSLFTIQYYAL